MLDMKIYSAVIVETSHKYVRYTYLYVHTGMRDQLIFIPLNTVYLH